MRPMTMPDQNPAPPVPRNREGSTTDPWVATLRVESGSAGAARHGDTRGPVSMHDRTGACRIASGACADGTDLDGPSDGRTGRPKMCPATKLVPICPLPHYRYAKHLRRASSHTWGTWGRGRGHLGHPCHPEVGAGRGSHLGNDLGTLRETPITPVAKIPLRREKAISPGGRHIDIHTWVG